MIKKSHISFVVMVMILFSLALFYQNCSAQKGDLGGGPSGDPGPQGCVGASCGGTGSITYILSKTENGPSETTFVRSTDSIYMRLINVSVAALTCTRFVNYESPEDPESCTPDISFNGNSEWGYDIRNQRYDFLHFSQSGTHELKTSYLPAGKFKTCFADQGRGGCLDFIITP